MDRQDAIFKFAQAVLQERAQSRYQQICKDYTANKQQIVNDFYQAVGQLIALTKRQQTERQKQPIRYVAALYLFSSTITKTYEFQLSLFDERYFLDPTESCVYWCPKWLFSYTEADKVFLTTAAKKEFIRLHTFELDAVWRAYVCGFYYSLAGLFFAEHLKSAAIACELNNLALMGEVDFVFGGYMDQSVKLGTLKG